MITPHAAYRNLLTPPESYGDTLLDGTRGGLGADAASANGQVGTYANRQHSRGNLLYRGSGAYRQAGDYDTPEGSVFNSATELSSGRTGLGYFGDSFFTSLSLTLEESRFGLPFEDRFHSHGDEPDHEAHGHENDDQIEIDLASQRRVARLDIGVESVDTRFDNRTCITRTLVYQRQQEHLTGRFGSELRFRNFAAMGAEALSPRTQQVALSAFGYEELTFGRYRLQVGGRLERTDYDAAGRPVLPGQDDDHDDEGEEHVLVAPDPRDRQFLAASASIGMHADLGAGSAIVANFTHSHRVPAAEELYNFGPHLGNFEIGRPDLEAETMRGLDVSFRQRLGRVQGEANFYVYGIDNFIFGDLTNEIVDNLRILNIRQGDSRFVRSSRIWPRRWAAGSGWATRCGSSDPRNARSPPLASARTSLAVSPLEVRQGRVASRHRYLRRQARPERFATPTAGAGHAAETESRCLPL